jgi:hypothetical protein
MYNGIRAHGIEEGDKTSMFYSIYFIILVVFGNCILYSSSLYHSNENTTFCLNWKGYFKQKLTE